MKKNTDNLMTVIVIGLAVVLLLAVLVLALNDANNKNVVSANVAVDVVEEEPKASEENLLLVAEEVIPEAKAPEYVNGIDVSQHQGNVDWTAVDAEVVVVRLGYSGYETGIPHVDAKFHDNMADLASYQGEIALYWASHSVSTAEVQKENEFILGELAKLSSDMLERIDFLFIDREKIHNPDDKDSDVGRADYISNDLFNEVLVAQVNGLTALLPGMNVGVYTNVDFLVTKIDTELLGDVPFWMAWYAKAGDYASFDEVVAKVSSTGASDAAEYLARNIVMWQYSDAGQVSGINAKTDLNLVSSKMLG